MSKRGKVKGGRRFKGGGKRGKVKREGVSMFLYSDVNKLNIFLVNLFNKFHEENSFI